LWTTNRISIAVSAASTVPQGYRRPAAGEGDARPDAGRHPDPLRVDGVVDGEAAERRADRIRVPDPQLALDDRRRPVDVAEAVVDADHRGLGEGEEREQPTRRTARAAIRRVVRASRSRESMRKPTAVRLIRFVAPAAGIAHETF
jgi:hypothetical protein